MILVRSSSVRGRSSGLSVHDLGSDQSGLFAYELDLQRVVLRNMRK